MSYWLLPQFLVTVLGAPPMAFGFIEGAAETIASFSRLLSGWLSDFLGRRKPLAAAGYTLANIVKPLLAVTQSWQQVFWIRFADRAAKGLSRRSSRCADCGFGRPRASRRSVRFAPGHGHRGRDCRASERDPLPAAVCREDSRRLLVGGDSRAWSAFCWCGSASRKCGGRASQPAPSDEAARVPAAFPRGKLLVILAAVGLFSLGNSSDLFLILRAQNLGMGAWTAPALGLLFNVVYAALSWPAGKLSDRVPRRWLVVAGYLIYAAVYAGFAWLRAPQLVWFLFAVYGTYYALTEGVMKAWMADLAPGDSRAWVFWRSQLGGGRCRVSRQLPGGMDLAALLARCALRPFQRSRPWRRRAPALCVRAQARSLSPANNSALPW